MYYDEALKHLRRAVLVIQRSCFRLAYCFEWETKTNQAIPLGNGRKYRNFQIICYLFIFFLAPAILSRSYHLAMSPPGQESPTATGITYAATIVVTGFVPMVWNLKKSSGPRKYVYVYQATMKLEKRSEGT